MLPEVEWTQAEAGGISVAKAAFEASFPQIPMPIDSSGTPPRALAKWHSSLSKPPLFRSLWFVCDSLPRGTSPLDHSPVTRFWSLTRDGVADAYTLGRPLAGFAGLAPHKRGVAIRILHRHLADARRTLLQSDDRFCELNYAIVARLHFTAEGFPFGAPPAIVQFIGPLRSFRKGGVLTWVLGFPSPPSLLRFPITAAGCTAEVLLAPEAPLEKVKGQGRQPNSVSTQDPNNKRIDSMERRISALERKTDNLADSQRQEVAGQLTRILGALKPTRDQGAPDPSAKAPRVSS